MPGIKKRIRAEYLAEKEQQGGENGNTEMDAGDASVPVEPPAPTAGKRKEKSGGELKKLDGEILVEKRKRTIPPAEQKLNTWLDLNFEKKPEVRLSPKQLYAFYTDMCQQDGSGVVEVNLFNRMLREKFGKEFGLKETSVYKGLLKEGKPKKKPTAKADSLGLKLKDLIEEALKASGNPTKGVRFAWIKKYIGTKYPAFQIELRPTMLRAALERGVGWKKLELVKGIGFCGYYRLPGPSEIDEEPKEKKVKTSKKDEEDKDATDVANGEEADAEKSEQSEEKTEVKEEVEEQGSKEDAEKAAKTKAKQKAKPRKKLDYKDIDHGDPQRIEETFPLALTYQSDPKEASFNKIKKYIEKHYRKADIEEKLLRELEHGCEKGKWDRVSGSGKSGSFQLLTDSFNPEETESWTDMVCSAIIACSEPKVASYSMIKKYISEYHPDFHIDAKPHLLKKAIERAIEGKMIVRVSGLGMTGSFQLLEAFTPSPAALAWGEEEEDDDDDEDDYADVYVVRKTKSGRKAPVDRLAYKSEKKQGRPASSPRGAKKSGRKAGKKARPKYADSDSEESEDSDVEEYTPRKTKSGRGGGSPAKSASRGTDKSAKKKGSASKSPARGKPAKSGSPNSKKGRPASARQLIKEESEEEEELYEGPPSKAGRKIANRSPSKSASASKKERPQSGRAKASKRSYTETSDVDDEEDFVVKEEKASPAKKAKKAAGKSGVPKTPEKQKSGGKAAESPGRPGRAASRSARKSLKESDSEEDDEPEYVARPTASGRAAKKR